MPAGADNVIGRPVAPAGRIGFARGPGWDKRGLSESAPLVSLVKPGRKQAGPGPTLLARHGTAIAGQAIGTAAVGGARSARVDLSSHYPSLIDDWTSTSPPNASVPSLVESSAAPSRRARESGPSGSALPRPSSPLLPGPAAGLSRRRRGGPTGRVYVRTRTRRRGVWLSHGRPIPTAFREYSAARLVRSRVRGPGRVSQVTRSKAPAAAGRPVAITAIKAPPAVHSQARSGAADGAGMPTRETGVKHRRRGLRGRAKQPGHCTPLQPHTPPRPKRVVLSLVGRTDGFPIDRDQPGKGPPLFGRAWVPGGDLSPAGTTQLTQTIPRRGRRKILPSCLPRLHIPGLGLRSRHAGSEAGPHSNPTHHPAPPPTLRSCNSGHEVWPSPPTPFSSNETVNASDNASDANGGCWACPGDRLFVVVACVCRSCRRCRRCSLALLEHRGSARACSTQDSVARAEPTPHTKHVRFSVGLASWHVTHPGRVVARRRGKGSVAAFRRLVSGAAPRSSGFPIDSGPRIEPEELRVFGSLGRGAGEIPGSRPDRAMTGLRCPIVKQIPLPSQVPPSPPSPSTPRPVDRDAGRESDGTKPEAGWFSPQENPGAPNPGGAEVDLHVSSSVEALWMLLRSLLRSRSLSPSPSPSARG
ncbi:hypothetical protein B2J93_9567 [Marssonina coronariae]|uniref:Uncharacterized protein n=1 Tax=Diplocarpon coronariae TaxID=2795749 RepID=A0A218YVB1_9HELO|nr:hypothetical protein B2J93_9567 [Marssonina coronariae]